MMQQKGEGNDDNEDQGGHACQTERQHPVLISRRRSCGDNLRLGRFARGCRLPFGLAWGGLGVLAHHGRRPKHSRAGE